MAFVWASSFFFAALNCSFLGHEPWRGVFYLMGSPPPCTRFVYPLRFVSGKPALFLIVIRWPTPGQSLRAGVISSSTVLWVWNSQRQGFSSCCYQKWPQGGSTGSLPCVLKGHLGLRECLLPTYPSPSPTPLPSSPKPWNFAWLWWYHPEVEQVFRKEAGDGNPALGEVETL